MEWFRADQRCSLNVSIIWRGFVEVAKWIKMKIAWKIGSGSSVLVGIDSVVSGGLSYQLSAPLVNLFHNRGYTSLDHFCTFSGDRRNYWLSPGYFHLEEPYKQEWSNYVLMLNRMGISLRPTNDILV